MSADKFVNKVQQKMDELRLSPNPQVWVEVERRIREKKKRRVIIFWFLFGGLLLAGGSYFVFNQSGNKKEPITINHKPDPVSNKTNNTTINNNPEENKKDNDFLIKDETVKTRQEVVLTEKKETAKPERTETPKYKEQKAKIAKTKQPESFEQVIKRKNDITIAKPSSEIKSNTQTGIKPNDDPVVTKKSEIAKTDNSTLIEPPIEIKDIVKQTKEDIQKPVEEKNDKADTVAKNDLAVEQVAKESEKKKDSTRKHKWEIGINAALGGSRLTKGQLLDLGMNKSADALNIPNSGTGSPAVPVSYADSIILKGSYWHLGVSAKKQLGKKIFFSAGLNFATYTTKQRVGVFVDSVNPISNDLRSQTYGGFYRAGQSTTYKNRYYFIQLPLLLHWQLNKGEKLPITWDNGFLPSFLIGSNAVAYDKISRTFYKDKRLYNDVQLVYHTGFSAGLFKNRKHPLTAGIFYNYAFSRLQKISPPDYNYLGSFGIKMNWVIKN